MGRPGTRCGEPVVGQPLGDLSLLASGHVGAGQHGRARRVLGLEDCDREPPWLPASMAQAELAGGARADPGAGRGGEQRLRPDGVVGVHQVSRRGADQFRRLASEQASHGRRDGGYHPVLIQRQHQVRGVVQQRLQRELPVLAIGDVALDGDPVRPPPRLVRDRGDADLRPELGAVLADVEQLHLDRAPALQRGAQSVELAAVGLRALQDPGCQAEDLVRLVPCHPGERRVDVEHSRSARGEVERLGLGHQDDVRGVHHDRLKQGGRTAGAGVRDPGGGGQAQVAGHPVGGRARGIVASASVVLGRMSCSIMAVSCLPSRSRGAQQWPQRPRSAVPSPGRLPLPPGSTLARRLGVVTLC